MRAPEEVGEREGGKGKEEGGEISLMWAQSLGGATGASEWSPHGRTVGFDTVANYRGSDIWKRAQEHPISWGAILRGPCLLIGNEIRMSSGVKMGNSIYLNPCSPLSPPLPPPTHPPTHPAIQSVTVN